MLAFLETSIYLDASGKSFSGSETLTAALTLHRGSDAAITSMTVAVPVNTDATVPYTAAMSKVDENRWLLTITLNQPLANIRFGEKRTLTITGNNAETFALGIEINYAAPLTPNAWLSNSAESTAVMQIEKSSIRSSEVNTRLRALLSTATTALNTARYALQKIGFKNKNLPDIIDFAIAAGASPLSSTTTVTRDASSGEVTQLVTDYTDERGVSQRIRVTYAYADYALKRLIKRKEVYQEVTSELAKGLNTLTVEALSNTNALMYKIGVVAIKREQEIICNIPHLKDYDDTLSPATVEADPSNQMSYYKYYKTFPISGWTVVA